MTAAGFPHSGITGSQPACGSPMLIAAYHALHRLSVPRHPPCALSRLTGSFVESPGPPSYPLTYTHVGCSHFLSLRTTTSLPLTRVVNGSLTALVLRVCVRGSCGRLSSAFDLRRLTRGSRKEVIQPQVPLRLPCYDFAPVIKLAFGRSVPEGFRHGLRALPTSMA
jgi:hypothetical protein